MFYAMSGKQHKKPAFSLLELTVVVVIIGAMSAVTIPVFSGTIVRRRVEATARRIAADLRLARKRAMQTDSPQSVTFDQPRNAYTVDGMAHPLKPKPTYTVKLEEEPHRVQMVWAGFPAPGDPADDAVINFDIYGKPDSKGWVAIESGVYRWWIRVDGDTGLPKVTRARPIDAPVIPEAL